MAGAYLESSRCLFDVGMAEQCVLIYLFCVTFEAPLLSEPQNTTDPDPCPLCHTRAITTAVDIA